MAAGRPPRDSVLEPMKSKAWARRVLHVAGATTQHAFEKKWIEVGSNLPVAQQVATPARIDRSFDGKISPQITTLANVEKYFAQTRRAYDLGPASYPLWDVLGGPIERSMEVLRQHVSEFHGLTVRPPVSAYLNRVERMYFNGFMDGVDLDDWRKGWESNVVEKRLAAEGPSSPFGPDPNIQFGGFTVDDVTVVLAAYRLATFTGISPHEFLYYLNGMVKVIEVLFTPWGIQQDVYTRINSMWDEVFRTSPLR